MDMFSSLDHDLGSHFWMDGTEVVVSTGFGKGVAELVIGIQSFRFE
jgi:hypothetical protein